MRLMEGEHQDIVARLKKLESQQNSVKKVEEFNALSQEMSEWTEKASLKSNASAIYMTN